ncbi:MAG: hypothetical protein V2A53_08960 [bacterium]
MGSLQKRLVEMLWGTGMTLLTLVNRILAIANPPSSPFDKGGQERDYL